MRKLSFPSFCKFGAVMRNLLRFAGRGAIFAILLMAGIAKLFSHSSTDHPWGRWLLPLLEISLATWQLLPWLSRARFYVTLSIVTAFTVHTSLRILEGNPNCNCFGAITINPLATLALDAGLLVCVLLGNDCLPCQSSYCNAGVGGARVQSIFFLTGVVVVSALGPVFAHRLGDTSESLGTRRVIACKTPQDLIGHPLPFAECMNEQGAMTSGTWTIVIFSRNCPHCRKWLEDRANLDELKGQAAIIDIDGSPNSSDEVFAELEQLARMRPTIANLSPACRYVGPLPVVLRVTNGMVTHGQIGR